MRIIQKYTKSLHRKGSDSLGTISVNKIVVLVLSLVLFFRPSTVAEGVLELITNTAKAGAVLLVTPRKGFYYHEFRDSQ